MEAWPGKCYQYRHYLLFLYNLIALPDKIDAEAVSFSTSCCFLLHDWTNSSPSAYSIAVDRRFSLYPQASIESPRFLALILLTHVPCCFFMPLSHFVCLHVFASNLYKTDAACISLSQPQYTVMMFYYLVVTCLVFK